MTDDLHYDYDHDEALAVTLTLLWDRLVQPCLSQTDQAGTRTMTWESEGHLYQNSSSRFSQTQPRSSRQHGPHDTTAFTQNLILLKPPILLPLQLLSVWVFHCSQCLLYSLLARANATILVSTPLKKPMPIKMVILEQEPLLIEVWPLTAVYHFDFFLQGEYQNLICLVASA